MAQDIAGGLRNVLPGPLDSLMGPYASLAAACTAIPNVVTNVGGVPKNFREGKFAIIGNLTTGYELHHWKNSYLDSGLVLLFSPESDASVYFLGSFDNKITITDTEISIKRLRVLYKITKFSDSNDQTLAYDKDVNCFVKAVLNFETNVSTLQIVNSPFWDVTLADNEIVVCFLDGGSWFSDYQNVSNEILNYYLTFGYSVIEQNGEVAGTTLPFNTSTGIGYNKGREAKGDGFYRNISIGAVQAGVVEFAVGLVDQYDKAIIERTFTRQAPSAGIHVYNDVNEPVKKGQTLFLLINGTIGYIANIGGSEFNLMRYNDQSISGILSDYIGEGGAAIQLGFDIEYKSYILSDAKEEISEISSELGSLKNTVAALSSVNPVKKVVAFGNSITKHPITPYWWGEWGMAATERSKDWVHVLESRLKVREEDAIVTAYNISAWEGNPTVYDYSILDQFLESDVEAVIVKVGENFFSNNYASQFPILIDYIESKVPNASIIIGGQSFPAQEKDNIMKTLAFQRSLPFADFSFTWSDPSTYQSTLDTLVYGDDGIWRPISDGGDIAGGVASHPNDLAMSVYGNSFADILEVYQKKPDLSLLQPKIDTGLNTTSKTVVGGINEVNNRIGSVIVQNYADILTHPSWGGAVEKTFYVTTDNQNMGGKKGAYKYVPLFTPTPAQIAINFND